MLTPDYPQFVPAEPPPDGSTVSAWRGVLQPFENDAAARSILCDIEQERTLWVSAGAIRSSASKEQHWAHPLITGMDVACEVMVCPQADAMPRAYLLSPRFQPYFADTAVHPHPRADHAFLHEGQLMPGLCVYSSAELAFRDDINFYTQFLDQLTQYVAKHLIWLRTRRLCRWNGSGLTVLYQPVPGEAIPEEAPSARLVQLPAGPIRVVDFWSGYWPGKAARAATPREHLRQIKRNQRCWCGLNKTYGECHRPLELGALSKLTDGYLIMSQFPGSNPRVRSQLTRTGQVTPRGELGANGLWESFSDSVIEEIPHALEIPAGFHSTPVPPTL